MLFAQAPSNSFRIKSNFVHLSVLIFILSLISRSTMCIVAHFEVFMMEWFNPSLVDISVSSFVKLLDAPLLACPVKAALVNLVGFLIILVFLLCPFRVSISKDSQCFFCISFRWTFLYTIECFKITLSILLSTSLFCFFLCNVWIFSDGICGFFRALDCIGLYFRFSCVL